MRKRLHFQAAAFTAVWVVVFFLTAVSFTPVLAQTAATYHVSSLNPAANDSNPGTLDLPWRTLARVQTAVTALQPGDQVLFERGGTYSGTLTVGTLNGTSSAPIVFGAYGTGTSPIISNLESLSGWVDLGGNRWQAVCAACGTALNHLLINGQTQRIARYPNLDQGDEGYLYYDSFSGRTSITDDALVGQNWVGGEIVVRTIAWILDRLPITAQSGGTLTSTTSATYDFEAGWGYFIQNHPAALDLQGEWVYTPATRTVTLYSTVNPASLLIQVTTTDRLWWMQNIRDVQLLDLAFYGGAEYTLDIGNCTRAQIQRVEVRYGGAVGLRASNCTGLVLTDSTISQSLTAGLKLPQCNDCSVLHNTIENIAMFAGLGKSGNLQYGGVEIGGTNSVFERNVVRYIGYVGIRFGGTVIVRSNVVSYFNQVKVDGGGIYTWQNNGGQVIGNVVLHGEGSAAGIAWGSTATHGIYIDDNSRNVEVRDNTVGYMSESGIYLHNTRNAQVTGNTIFDVAQQGILLGDDDLGTDNIENSLIENNQVFATGSNTVGMRILTNKTESAFLSWVGTLRSNSYCLPTNDSDIRMSASDTGTQVYTLAQWQSRTGQESGSTTCDLRLPAYVETGTLGSNQIANSTLDSNANGWVRWPENISSLTWDSRMGGSLRFARTGGGQSIYAYHVIGPVTQNTLYRVRLRGVSDTAVSVQLVLSRQGGDYGWVSAPTSAVIDTTERDIVVYLRPNSTETNVRLNVIMAGSGPIWLDNVEVTPVTATPLTADAAARFEYNTTDSAGTVVLDQAYIDVRGNPYAAGSTVTIAPFSSIVLVRPAPTVSASLNGTVTLQGRTAGSSAMTGTLTLQLYQNSALVGSYTPTTDVNGAFSLSGLSAGSYRLRVKHAQYLASVQDVVLVGGNNAVSIGPLRAGDVDDSNRVNLIDFSILAASFNRVSGQTGYDARADLNGDGQVTIVDFSLLAGSFNQSGAN